MGLILRQTLDKPQAGQWPGFGDKGAFGIRGWSSERTPCASSAECSYLVSVSALDEILVYFGTGS